ncbi:minor tail protein [Streptomyces phage Attoomi]|uniref:Minor tail protein n=1 Tax=Streptomyces phage Attoomi TaxID=2059881 RepID=A0A2H5BLD4_9CAUD|nr:minor tail protein [Streptomyces phage Attoomi]AUG87148.1 minor tail protein [Streptomyces phage Attoomi]
MAGDLVTQDGQIQFGGVLFGETTEFVGDQLTGWDDLPDLDVGSVPMPTQHGAWPGALLAGVRELQWDFTVLPDDLATFPQLLARLRAATAPTPDERELVVQLAGARRLMRARVIRRALPADRQYTKGEPSGSIVWQCSDPRRYSVEESVAGTALPSREPGLGWSGAPANRMSAGQAAGTGPLYQWWSENNDPVITGDGTGPASVQALTEGRELGWSVTNPNGDYGWPVKGGEPVVFTNALAPVVGGVTVLNWWGPNHTFLDQSVGLAGLGTLSVTAPAGAVSVQPIVSFPTAMAAPVPIGTASLTIGTGEGLAYPLDWGTPGSTGSVAPVNAGDAPAHPVVEFRGPVVRPKLTQTATGRALEYDITLTESDVLTVDTAAGTVLLNGTASRLYTATRASHPEQTFTLEPGETPMTFRCANQFYDPAASVTVRWRNAYW